MTTIKPILITVASLISLVIIWSQFSSSPVITETQHPDKQQTDKSVATGQSNLELLKRIQSVEYNLEIALAKNQQHEIRLTELEHQLENVQNLSHQISVSKADETLSNQTKTVVKPLTLHDKLVKSNIPLDTIQRIQSRVGENRLARLQLRDQAIREDWIDTPEYIQQRQELPGATDGLREEFGDQIYDQYLFASGRPNRVIVREVFSGSAAEQAGIKPGDIVTSYASSTVYSMGDLQQATTEGSSGETVLIELLRDDAPFTTSAPRGPLGISMTFTRESPEQN